MNLKYNLIISGGVCTDINECKQNKCGRGAYCNNTDGSYECKCKRSDKIYDSTLKKCKKINCPLNTCSKNGKCVKEGRIFFIFYLKFSVNSFFLLIKTVG